MARLRASVQPAPGSTTESRTQAAAAADSEKAALEQDAKIVDDELRYWILDGVVDEDVHLPSFWDVSGSFILPLIAY